MGQRRFPTDLTDLQWAVVEPLVPPAASGGRRRHVNMREVINAIRYLESTGCGWRGLPDTFPNRSTVWHYYSQWRKHELWPLIDRTVRLAAEAAEAAPVAPTGVNPQAVDPPASESREATSNP